MIRKVMAAIHPCVAGLDVHQETVVACRRRLLTDGQAEAEVQRFQTTTAGLRQLAAWLAAWHCTHVAMESTGVYWVPIWNLLEGHFQLVLVNAQHLKKVPGRKADVPDAEWLAQCMQCGLLRASFVPDAEMRQWRDLTRQRMRLVDHRTAVVNRLHKALEQGNIKLGSVASDICGVSGKAIIRALSDGEREPQVLAGLARGRLRAKYAELVEALDGELNESHRWLLARLLEQLAMLNRELTLYNERIRARLLPYEAALVRLDTIGGVGRRTAEDLVAEIGLDMSQFPTAAELVSWAGLCPGRHESAGKNRRRTMPKGNRWLKRVLLEAAWAATHEKESYLAALYRRLLPRRGKQRAILAVARTILVAAWHILKKGVEYQELGGDYFDRLNVERTKGYLVKRLEKLGYEVEVKAKASVA